MDHPCCVSARSRSTIGCRSCSTSLGQLLEYRPNDRQVSFIDKNQRRIAFSQRCSADRNDERKMTRFHFCDEIAAKHRFNMVHISKFSDRQKIT